jgi:hypothetical protein
MTTSAADAGGLSGSAWVLPAELTPPSGSSPAEAGLRLRRRRRTEVVRDDPSPGETLSGARRSEVDDASPGACSPPPGSGSGSGSVVDSGRASETGPAGESAPLVRSSWGRDGKSANGCLWAAEAGGTTGSAGTSALCSDIGKIPSCDFHDARSPTQAGTAKGRSSGSNFEPSRSIH